MHVAIVSTPNGAEVHVDMCPDVGPWSFERGDGVAWVIYAESQVDVCMAYWEEIISSRVGSADSAEGWAMAEAFLGGFNFLPCTSGLPRNHHVPLVTGATEAQQRYIRSLCAERGVDADVLLSTLKDRYDASDAIDRLKAQQARPATERQLAFLEDLLATREHDYADDVLNGISFEDASAMITRIQGLPRVGKPAHGIRQGRYAYQPEGAQAQFYRVGQAGGIYVQAGPVEHPYNGKLNEALEAIKADPQAHAALYGRLIGRCGRCGLELTDETSRARGLGPICAEKSDW